jgi:hypothetical protein
MQKIIANINNNPSSYLLVLQLISIALHPLLQATEFSQAIFLCFNVAALSMAVGVVNKSPALTWIAWTLAVPSITLTCLYVIFGSDTYLLWAQIFESIMFFYTAAGLVMYMFNDDILTRDELISAATTFTVLAWGFALAYSVCQQIYPGSITGTINPDGARTWVELIFFSFSILSGTGYGDIMVTHPVARVIVTFHMFVGLMYMALIVSRLVALTTSKRR